MVQDSDKNAYAGLSVSGAPIQPMRRVVSVAAPLVGASVTIVSVTLVPTIVVGVALLLAQAVITSDIKIRITNTLNSNILDFDIGDFPSIIPFVS
jgi:hypothetical protein